MMEAMEAISAVLPGLAASATGDPSMGLPGGALIGNMMASVGLDPSFLVKIGVSLTIVASVFGFLSNAWEGIIQMTKFFSDNLVSSATIRSTDEAYVYVMRWLYTHQISTDSRLFGVTCRKNQLNPNYRQHTRWYGSEPTDETEADGINVLEDDLGPKLKYTAAPGFYHFFYKRRLVLMQRKLKEDYYGFEEPEVDLVLFTFGRSPVTLREILEAARQEYLMEQRTSTLIHTTNGSYPATWSLAHAKPSRSLDSVIMKESDKERLLKDMKEYLAPSAKRWYQKHGLPYRRGYLFYGLPGAGKTSLTTALASELSLPIYCLSLASSSMADDVLLGLFATLPKKCIILLEDIDSAGIDRQSFTGGGFFTQIANKNEEEDDEEEEEEIRKREEKKKLAALKQGSSVSLSGLLNAIDGISSHEGRILIMTTNYRELLDKALIRPGRVDMEIQFGNADIEILEGLFKAVYADLDDLPGFIRGKSKMTKEERAQKHKEKLEKLAQEFSSRVPSDKFTPAEVQGYLLSHKSDPEDALDCLDEWLQSKLREINLVEQAEQKAKEKLERATERKIKELQKKKRDRLKSERKELEEEEKEEKEKKEKKEKEEKEKKEKEEKEKKEKEDKEKKEKEGVKNEDAAEAKSEKSAEVKKLTNGTSELKEKMETGDLPKQNGLVNGVH
ncbi:hypothetical protein TWF694_011670 [Orbilia ellipsospora]|uniref:Mitochondrial chaperone BCS1 n=1 Tax=Orbilia ellipsospora TaxID=2528407 RepID=A0AAV9X5V6_9PEZI